MHNSLTPEEIDTIDQIEVRFDRHRNQDSLAEGTINQLIISPLLTLAGLYDEPFFVSTEPSMEIEFIKLTIQRKVDKSGISKV